LVWVASVPHAAQASLVCSSAVDDLDRPYAHELLTGRTNPNGRRLRLARIRHWRLSLLLVQAQDRYRHLSYRLWLLKIRNPSISRGKFPVKIFPDTPFRQKGLSHAHLHIQV
jgi:hypothetical protein